ncbi:hypothetical protein LT330_005203 [Penicillium expansum]|nr:hypothetical protein LT330_005203 [Penicillium expansum]
MASPEEPIEIPRQAVETTPPNRPNPAILLNNLAISLRNRYSRMGKMEDLDNATEIMRLLVKATPPDHPDQAMHLNNIGVLLRDRYSQIGRIADLEEALKIAQQAVAATPPGHPDGAERLSNVAGCLRDRYLWTGVQEDLNEATKIARQVIETTPPDHPNRAMFCHSLVSCLLDTYLRIRRVADLEEAIKIARQVVETTPPDHLNRAIFCHSLANCLRNRYSRTMMPEDIDEAIKTMRQVIEATSPDHIDRAAYLNDLAGSLRDRYLRFGEQEDLEEGIKTMRQAIEATPSDHPDRTTHLNNLAGFLYDRCLRTREQEDLEEAIKVSRQSVEATPPDHIDRAHRIDRLGAALSERYSRTGMVDDLEEAIKMARQAIEATSSDHPDRAIYLNNLGSYLYGRYSWTGTMKDLEEAIKMMGQAIEDTRVHHLERARSLNNLATFLGDRYLQTGTIANLEEAIEIARQSIDAIPPDYPDRAIYLSNLGNHLRNRFSQTGAMADLEDAINIAREAVTATPSDHSARGERLNNLAMSLYARYIRTETMQDIEEASRIAQQVLEVTPPDHPKEAMRKNNHAALLLEANKNSQTWAVADFDKVIETAQQAVEATPLDHPYRAEQLHNISIFLFNRYERSDEIADLESSIELSRQADEAYPVDHPNRAVHLIHLGISLQCRFARKATLTDLKDAQRLLLLGLEHTTAAMSIRVSAGRHLISLHAIFKRLNTPQEAYSISRKTIELIPFLSSRSLKNSDKRHLLSVAVGLSSDAAAIALCAEKDSVTAIECLEIGRGIIADALFEQSNISALRMKHPQLANSLMELLEKLDSPSSRGFSDMLDDTALVESEGSQRQEAIPRLHRTLQTIRSLHEFDRFLLPASKDDILEAARSGPIVIINVSDYRCDALIIQHTGVRLLWLPFLTKGDLHSKVTNIRSLETLVWLWDVIICPIMDVLGFKETPKDDNWPHVWWIPTGILTRFPLHAAGHHLRACGETALDRVISSYSSSVKAIIQGRQQVSEMSVLRAPANAVIVSMQRTPKQEPLPFASVETDTVLAICKAMGLSQLQPQPYKPSVLSALADCRIFHFAGHGSTHPSEPLHSQLLLEDWESQPLTVESLLEVNLSSNPPFLAYLSACGTGQLLDERSMDENIHIASAYQLAGFRHVIGTLWSVDDEFSVDMARMTYEFFRDAGMSDETVSRGLHHACRILRDQWVQADCSARILSPHSEISNQNSCEVVPSRWSLGSESLRVLVDRDLGNEFRRTLHMAVEQRIVGEIQILDTNDFDDHNAVKLTLKKRDDSSIGIYGPSYLTGYEGPVRGAFDSVLANSSS